ncbi:NTP transferase domain-containing protein [Leptospira idonii]|uniref:Nucleotidyltransferase family protein n=1 Tax=Leptospira idonii TaxID=1193500 RepID=A0A4R9M3B8_9LEPT|nr:NTP transferase domain-containing protein [Leptospira idonii]TGN20385.1 nucleotidyltransferase family protein [Leptospira idonii]
MNVFFLAAGFGKRMGDWTKTTPKPLLKISEISFLDYSLYLANSWGAKKAWINVHYLAEQIERHLTNFNAFPLKIAKEKQKILGTAGGIRTALSGEGFNETILLFNPDTLLFPDSKFEIRKDLPKDSSIHLYLQKRQPNDPYTKIDLGTDGKLEFGKGEFYYIGLCLLDPKILSHLPEGEYFDLSDNFKEMAKLGKITGEEFLGSTLDLGEKDLYESFIAKNVFGDQKKTILDFIRRSFP